MEKILTLYRGKQEIIPYKIKLDDGTYMDLTGKTVQFCIADIEYSDWGNNAGMLLVKEKSTHESLTETLITFTQSNTALLIKNKYKYRIKVQTMSGPTVVSEDWTPIYDLHIEQ